MQLERVIVLCSCPAVRPSVHTKLGYKLCTPNGGVFPCTEFWRHTVELVADVYDGPRCRTVEHEPRCQCRIYPKDAIIVSHQFSSRSRFASRCRPKHLPHNACAHRGQAPTNWFRHEGAMRKLSSGRHLAFYFCKRVIVEPCRRQPRTSRS